MQLNKTIYIKGKNLKFQELEPMISEELCKLWDADHSSQGEHTPEANNGINRYGRPSVQSDTHPTPCQW